MFVVTPSTFSKGFDMRKYVCFTGMILLTLIFAQGCATNSSAARDKFTPQTGDLLFQDLDGSPLCDAIEKVTQGYNGAHFSHVGIAAKNNAGDVVVIEAGGKGVVATPLAKFLAKSHDSEGCPKVLVARLLPEYRHLIPPAIAEAQKLMGKPYDRVFDIDNDKYYCSELVYIIFRQANGGQAVFELQPMTFRDQQTGKTLKTWEDYFARLGEPIPEGKPGINPGGISRSPILEIVHIYGMPDGFMTATGKQ